MKISAFSIRRPIFTLITMIFVLVLGTVSLLNIPLKLIPDINPPVGVVVTSYEGASPTEVSEKVGRPMEASLSTLPGLKTMTSTSQEGANLTLLEFSWSTDLEEVENDVLRSIENAALPDDAGRPQFLKFNPSQFPVIQLTMSSEESDEALQELADQLQLELSKVPGVANVNVSGIAAEEVRITIDEDKMKLYKLDQSDIVNAIVSNNVSLPGEKIETEGKNLSTRIISGFQGPDDIRNLTLLTDPATGEQITIGYVAVVEQISRTDGTITRTNEKPSVMMSVLQQSDANTADVSEEFQTALDELLKEEKYKNIEADILFDQGNYIQLAIGSISTSLVVGGLLAMLILVLFLRSVKSPIIIGIAIPYSVILTFVLMYFSGFTLNIMTLGGLALGIGMLVDNSIVVIENIYRHLAMGKDPKEAARTGTKEIGGAITASTLTTIVVFLPVAFITGIIGDLFLEFALTISFSLIASLLVALTVVPMLASRWLKRAPADTEAKRKNSRSMKILKKMIEWSLLHRLTVVLLTVMMLAAGLFGLTTVGTQFLPNTDEGYFSINVELENGAAISETEKAVDAIEKELVKVKEVDVYVSYIGSTQEGSFRGTLDENRAEVYVKLVDLEDRERSVFQIADTLEDNLERTAREANETAEVSLALQSSSGTSPNTLTFNLRDIDKQRLEEETDKVAEAIRELPDVTEVRTDLSERTEELQIEVNRDKARLNGLAPAQIANAVNDITRGVFATQIVTEEGQVQSVMVQYGEEDVNKIDQMKQLSIKKADGSYVRLADLADFRIKESPVKIQRINNQDAVQFHIQYKDSTTLGQLTEQVEKVFKDVGLSAETEVVYSGERDLLDTAMSQLGLALVLAIIFIYLVMAAQFESLKYPFVVMFSVPLFVIGVSVAMAVTRTPIGITALIGVIVLAGIVVNNAIVIVDYINKQKESGMSAYDAIVTSVQDRVRPVLMTSLTTILGLVPMALGIGEGTEINQPMGIAVIGGLISSTFLTLIFIPVIYSFFDKGTKKRRDVIKQSRKMKDRSNILNGQGTSSPSAIYDIYSILEQGKKKKTAERGESDDRESRNGAYSVEPFYKEETGRNE